MIQQPAVLYCTLNVGKQPQEEGAPEVFISTEGKTHSLNGATQRGLAPPRGVPLAAAAEPGLAVVDSGGASPLLTVAGAGKVRVRVARTTGRVRADGLEVLRGWTGQGELKGRHEGARHRVT